MITTTSRLTARSARCRPLSSDQVPRYGVNPTYCSQLVRSPNTGGLVGTASHPVATSSKTNINIGAASVSGIDLQAGYKLDLPPPGVVRVHDERRVLAQTTTTPLPVRTLRLRRLFGATCQTINPRWHISFRTTWLTTVGWSRPR